MKGDNNSTHCEDFQRVEKAIQFIQANFKTQPSLDQIAASAHLSKYHFNRVFKRWAGVSPIQFLQSITLDYTKKRLAESSSLLDTALEAGLSGTSRLHDLFVTFEATTPGEFKRQGQGLKISYGFCDSPFGQCLLATTKRGICYLGFSGDGGQAETLNQLFSTWPRSEFSENSAAVSPIVSQIFGIDRLPDRGPFNLLIKGTNFQINVWRALLKVPMGALVSYQDIAEYIGHSKSFRAVANAIAINPVAYLIPCHRVIAKTGVIHHYRWGAARKKALIAWEASKIGSATA